MVSESKYEQYELFPNFAFIQTPAKKPHKTLKDVEAFLERHEKGFQTDSFITLLSHVPIDSAVNSWICLIENEETQKKYKRSMQYIFYGDFEPLKGFIETKSSIMELDKDYSSVGFYNAIQDLPLSEYVKKSCRAAFSCFCNYIRTITRGVIDAEPTLRQQAERQQAYEIYKHVDFEAFTRSLEDPFRLIAEITYEISRYYGYRLRLCDPRNSFLKLKTDQIDFKNATIKITKDQSYHPAVPSMLFKITPYLLDRLKSYIGDREGLVFLSKLGTPLFPRQIQRAFEKASRKIGHTITPVTFSWLGVVVSKAQRHAEIKF